MVKASIRKPITEKPLGKPAPYIDVEATVVKEGDTQDGQAAAQRVNSDVDETSAEKLAKDLEAGAPVPGSDEEVTQQRPQSHAVSRYVGESDGGLKGDFDSTDIKLPQLKIVNGSGPLSQTYNTGTLLYADEQLWAPPDPKEGAKNPIMRFVPLEITKQFRENLTEDENKEGLIPRIVNSRQEAEDLGGGTRWVDNQKPRWSPTARCVLLLQEYEGCEHPGFNMPLDGKNWALAVYYASGTAYAESAKEIVNAAQISLREKGKIVLHSRVWTFQVVKKKAGQFTVFVPSMKLTKDITGAQVREMAEVVRGGKQTETGE